jgi:hypothetical protein
MSDYRADLMQDKDDLQGDAAAIEAPDLQALRRAAQAADRSMDQAWEDLRAAGDATSEARRMEELANWYYSSQCKYYEHCCRAYLDAVAAAGLNITATNGLGL